MKKRVLITGASGFVGYHLILEALRKDFEVFAAARPSSKTAHLQHLPIQFTSLSYSDPLKLKTELENNQYTYIIHAAGSTRAKTQQEYNRVNAEYSDALAGSASIADIPLKKFVFISSLAALGPVPGNYPEPISASHPPHPVTAYGRSKLLAEKYLSEIKDLPLVVLRPTAVYGPRERDLFVVIRSLARGIEPYIGRNSQKLSFVYVKDLAEVTMQALESHIRHRSYTISDGRTYSKYEFAEISKQVLGSNPLKFHMPLALVKTLAYLLENVYYFSKTPPVLNLDKLSELTAENWSCSIQEAVNDLHYNPAYTLEKGLSETIRWYKENGWL